MIGRLTAAIDGEERMWQMRSAQQTGLIRSAPDCVNRFMLEQEQFVQLGQIFSLRRDNFLLHRERTSESLSPNPTHVNINNRGAHICVAPGRPNLALSCARR